MAVIRRWFWFFAAVRRRRPAVAETESLEQLAAADLLKARALRR